MFPYGIYESLSLASLPLVLPLPKKVKHEKDEYKIIPNKETTTDLVRGKNC